MWRSRSAFSDLLGNTFEAIVMRELVLVQVQVQLSGYVLASVYGGDSANYSYPLYYDMGAPVQDHFLNFKVCYPVKSVPSQAHISSSQS